MNLIQEIRAYALRRQLTTIAIIGASLILSMLTGYGFAQNSGYMFLLVLAGGSIVFGLLLLVIPIEWVFLFTILGTLLADTTLWIGGINFYLTRFIPLGMLCIRALLALGTRQIRISDLPVPFLVPLGTLALFALASTLYSAEPAITALRAITLILMIIAYSITIPVFMPTLERQKRGLWLIVGLAAIILAASIAAVPFLDRGYLNISEGIRARGIFRNPNAMGLLAMLTLFPVIGWWQNTRKQRRWPVTILVVTTMAALLLSGSRASFAGLLGGISVYVLLRNRSLKQSALWISLIILMGLVLLLAPSEYRAGLLRFDTGLRPQLWSRSIIIGMRSPIFGHGFGSDLPFVQDIPNLKAIGIYSTGPHSSYLRLFVHSGIIGLATFGAGIFVILSRSLKAMRLRSNDTIIIHLVAAVVAGLVNGFFESFLLAFGAAPAILFWLYVALLAHITSDAGTS